MSEIVVGQIKPSGAFEWRWPSGNTEKFGCSWTGEVNVNGKSFQFRHALGSRFVYELSRAHSVTWLGGRPMVEGVAADDYGQSQALLSLLKKPDRKLFRPHEEIPEGYGDLSVVAFHEEILAHRSRHALAVKIVADNVVPWVTHAIIRAVSLGHM
jgi:hypothetical protein